ncbi:ATP synthase F1 subunit delta [Acidobacteriota bacterium]
MKENSLAKRYASGMIKSVKDEHEYVEIKRELEIFLELLDGNKEFKAGMESNLFSKKQKRELLDVIQKKAKFGEKTFNFLLTMLEQNRLVVLDLIIQYLEELWFERNGVEKLRVFSAVELDEPLEKKLIKNLEQSFDKKIVIEKEVDESLLAGIKIQRGSIFYDFSISGNLRKLRDEMVSEIDSAAVPEKEP